MRHYLEDRIAGKALACPAAKKLARRARRRSSWQPIARESSRSLQTSRRFCRSCGSMLFYIVRDGQYAHVQMGTMIRVCSHSSIAVLTEFLPKLFRDGCPRNLTLSKL